MRSDGPRLFHLFERAYRAFRQRSERELLSRAGVPLAQVGALFALHAAPGQRLTELALALGLKKPAASALVQRMLDARLITRDRDPDDARTLRLALAPAGREAAKQALPIVLESNRALQARFSEDELEIVARFFRALIEHNDGDD